MCCRMVHPKLIYNFIKQCQPSKFNIHFLKRMRFYLKNNNKKTILTGWNKQDDIILR